MSVDDSNDVRVMVRQFLEPDASVAAVAQSSEATVAVTDRRVIVAAPGRVLLAVPFSAVRRIEFDLERDRPATLVIVPDNPGNTPQVLEIPDSEIGMAARAFAIIGQRLGT